MEYSIKPCTDESVDCLAEKYDEEIALRVPSCPEAEEERIIFKVTDEADNIIGGCILRVDYWMIANISNVWVDERYRGQGMGSALMRRAECTAKERKCYIALLGTYDFQARPFYEKHGYTVYGTIVDWPMGHKNYSMMKRLDCPDRDVIASEVVPKQAYEIRYGSEEDADIIGESLDEYDYSRVPCKHDYVSFDKKVLNKDGDLIAGATASVNSWNCTRINFIWVEEQYRNKGIGSALLQEMEWEAKENGGYVALAGAFEWQRGFFEKNGYEMSSSLDDCPRGHSWHLLVKRF